ncbi:acylphosphatase [Pisciglobus halotolerans]|uniref:acylphosphatase n=2 Tax=Pisciglobus halotolerans TaxID=745365 RepID=A0A1I3CWK1_9LACT|nr:acylphosphatase [Pisciglobus halotolerans]
MLITWINKLRKKIAPAPAVDPKEFKTKGDHRQMKKVRILVKGMVQGVGFRYTTKMLADKLGIAGIVRNENDGSVYIEANGSPERIDAFIDGIKRSPSPSASVEDVTVEEDESIEERMNFTVTN